MVEQKMQSKQIHYFFDTDVDTINPSIVHVLKMCQAFANNGHDVTLHCNREAEHIDLDELFERYGITARYEIRTVRISDFLRKHGHRFGSYYSAWLKAKQMPAGACAYSRSAMSLLFVKDRAPFVYEAHLEPDVISRQIERCILRHPNCRGLTVISHALKRRYLELFPFFSEERITVLHDAADPQESGSCEKAPLHGAGDGITIGYVGSLFPGKCMETLLPLAKACPQQEFHIVGGNPYWVNYWKEKADAQMADNLIFYGFVDNSRLGEYYRAFDLCILPLSKDVFIGRSRRVNIGRWISPLKLFEAMAYEKPILVSRLATIEEVMEDGVDCVMVEPDRIDDWKQKLETVCGDEALRRRIGRAAKEKLLREYTWAHRARKAAALFD